MSKTINKLDIFRSVDKGTLPPNRVMKDSDQHKFKKCGDRNLKYKPNYKNECN